MEGGEGESRERKDGSWFGLSHKNAAPALIAKQLKAPFFESSLSRRPPSPPRAPSGPAAEHNDDLGARCASATHAHTRSLDQR